MFAGEATSAAGVWCEVYRCLVRRGNCSCLWLASCSVCVSIKRKGRGHWTRGFWDDSAGQIRRSDLDIDPPCLDKCLTSAVLMRTTKREIWEEQVNTLYIWMYICVCVLSVMMTYVHISVHWTTCTKPSAFSHQYRVGVPNAAGLDLMSSQCELGHGLDTRVSTSVNLTYHYTVQFPHL